MGVRIDVGIDAKGHIGDLPSRRSQRIDDFQFGKTLYVEATDPQFKRNLYFSILIFPLRRTQYPKERNRSPRRAQFRLRLRSLLRGRIQK